MDLITSLITQIKNPFQYIIVGGIGIIMIYFKIDKQYFVYVIIFSMGVAYVLEKLWKMIKVKLSCIYNYFKRKQILKILLNLTRQEKQFLYNRIYENANELQIDMRGDSYFYEQDKNTNVYKLVLYKKEFNTTGKVGIFLRNLEKKAILENAGNQTMRIPKIVWDVLIKNSDDIFISLKPNDKK